MRFSCIFVSLAAVVLLARPGSAQDRIALTDVTVVDVRAGSLAPGMTVVIAGGRIVTVDRASAVRLERSTRRVDGTGRFLIPGLWDMHVHFQASWAVPRVDFPLYLANGVTGVRLMVGDCEPSLFADSLRALGDLCGIDSMHDFWPAAASIAEWRRAVSDGRLAGPRVVAASILFDGPVPCWPGSYRLTDPDTARARVREAQRRGADFIKVYSCSLSRDVYLAIADEARRIGIPFAGHTLAEVGWAEAAALGHKSIEHAAMLMAQCTTAPEEVAAARERNNRERNVAAGRALGEVVYRTFSVDRCAPMIAALRAHGTAFVPTLSVADLDRFTPAILDDSDPRLRYLMPRLRDRWRRASASIRNVPPENFEGQRRNFERWHSAITAMERAGVLILAGSDALNAAVFPGFSLHDELALLVRAGLSPLAALQAATLWPARFFGNEDQLGTIEAGKQADLVLLDRNPLENIRNTTRVHAVIAAGRLFDRAALDALLAGAAAAAELRVRPAR